MNRRYFLMGTAASAALGTGLRAASPNDTVRIACAGIRGRGKDHVKLFPALPNVELAALCDVDDSVVAARLQDVEKAGRKRPAVYSDFRKLLEDKSIDAVSIASPNHWHTLMTIWALQAGKDVYVEKPCSHNIFESGQIVAAARKYNRIVEHGTQSRSSPALREAHQKLREGVIGNVYHGRGLCYKTRDTIGRKPAEPVPAGVNYDLWLGPAPKHEFTRNRFHYNWHWFWDYGNGDIGNQGVHEMDACRWMLGVKYPTKVSAIGGHFMFDDDQETPNTLTAMFEFKEGGATRTMNFEVRHWITNHESWIGGEKPGPTVGTLFYGSQGYMALDAAGYKTYLGKEQAPGPGRTEAGSHWKNFIDAVRSRKREDLNAEVEEGAISCTLIHLANISYRLGRTLHFDPATLRCTGDEQANAMFTRNYREGFTVPKKV
ncbi:MAG: Gfo/Idh/MocA family oxidoreductase [Acidobacteria bacterium]|nr:Gfo/Idh/MocA family oxidoreductase [Acidobacteriota bacterium]